MYTKFKHATFWHPHHFFHLGEFWLDGPLVFDRPSYQSQFLFMPLQSLCLPNQRNAVFREDPFSPPVDNTIFVIYSRFAYKKNRSCGWPSPLLMTHFGNFWNSPVDDAFALSTTRGVFLKLNFYKRGSSSGPGASNRGSRSQRALCWTRASPSSSSYSHCPPGSTTAYETRPGQQTGRWWPWPPNPLPSVVPPFDAICANNEASQTFFVFAVLPTSLPVTHFPSQHGAYIEGAISATFGNWFDISILGGIFFYIFL